MQSIKMELIKRLPREKEDRMILRRLPSGHRIPQLPAARARLLGRVV